MGALMGTSLSWSTVWSTPHVAQQCAVPWVGAVYVIDVAPCANNIYLGAHNQHAFVPTWCGLHYISNNIHGYVQ